MRGSRTNYGRHDDCKRVTVRLYGDVRQWVEEYAETHGVSVADAICITLEGNMKRLSRIVKYKEPRKIKVRRKYLYPEQVAAYLRRGGKLSRIKLGSKEKPNG